MNILINTSPLNSGHAIRGIGTYTRLLLDSLRLFDSSNSYYSSTDLTLNTKHLTLDIVHYPFFDLFFPTLPLMKPAPTIVTIHDVIPLVFKSAYPPGIKGTLSHLLQKLSLLNTTHIVTDSNCSTQDTIKFLNQPKSKVTTVYLAPNPAIKTPSKTILADTKTKYSLNKPYFLYVGDINYNKNLPELLSAFSQFKQHFDLVLVSSAITPKNPAAKFLYVLFDQFDLLPHLKIIPNLPADNTFELSALYSQAYWYIQPSLYEGFGLPILEAQNCNCPVISSTGGSLPEICGNSVLSFTPLSDVETGFKPVSNHPDIKPISTSLPVIIEKALSLTSSNRSDYINKGHQNTLCFSWPQTVSQLVKIYSSI